MEVLFQPLKIVGTHIPHIFIPHPTLEWPTEAWNSQFLFPTNENIQPFPSPVSATLSHIHDHTNTFLDPGGITHDASVCKDVSFGSPVSFRYESRIPNWTGGGKRNNEGERRRRRWHQGGNFTRNFCYPSLTPPRILVQGPWRHLFLESARIPDIRLSCYANRYIQESRTFPREFEMIRWMMNYLSECLLVSINFEKSDKLKFINAFFLVVNERFKVSLYTSSLKGKEGKLVAIRYQSSSQIEFLTHEIMTLLSTIKFKHWSIQRNSL